MGGQVLDYEGKQIWKQGITQGIKQGVTQGVTQGITQGTVTAIRNLMDSLSWTAEQAMDALKIAGNERAMYRKLL